MTFKHSNLEELIVSLRLHLGDTTLTPTYSDETLHQALFDAVEALMNRWHNKYYIDSDNVVQRNLNNSYFDFYSPPVIQRKDRRAIVLQASIIIKQGKKYSNSDNVVSWKDDEVSYSSIESGKQVASSLREDIEELNSILPAKKLARPLSGRLDGFTKDWE